MTDRRSAVLVAGGDGIYLRGTRRLLDALLVVAGALTACWLLAP